MIVEREHETCATRVRRESRRERAAATRELRDDVSEKRDVLGFAVGAEALTRDATVRRARGGERYVREKFSWRQRAKHAPYDASPARENRKVRNFLGPDKG